jgi:PAS domain S-box-containing protein
MAKGRNTPRSSASQRRCASRNDVVELRRRVAELERANERLSKQLQAGGRQSDQSILENINDIAYTTDLEGNLVSVNQAIKRILGFDPQEVIGTHYSRWMSPEDFNRVEAVRPEVLQGQRRTNRAVLRDREGKEHHVEISVGPLVVDGRIQGTQGIIRDVTAQQRAEGQIRESEEKLRALFNAASESILLVDGQGTILTMNDTAARRLGRPGDEMIGRRPVDMTPHLLPLDVAERREAVIRQVFETGQAAYLEDERLGVHFDTSMYPVFGADGKVTSVAIFAKDITKQRIAQEDTRKFKAVFDNAAYGAAIATCDGYLLYVNEAFARMHGCEPAEPVGQHLSIFHSQDQPPRVNSLDERLRAEGSYAGEEVWHVRKDGTVFPTLMNGTVITNDQGRPLFWAWMVTDITERKRAEEEIRKLQRQIEFMFGATKTGLNITDKDFNLHFVDANWCRHYGPYQGRKCYEYFHGADHPCSECGIPKALETKQIVVYESALPKERNRPIQVSTIPFQDEDGEWLVAELNIDITERQHLERRLRESEERYRTVVETAGETIAVVDGQGVFQFMNTTAAGRLGGRPADFVGKTMWDLFPKGVADQQVTHIRGVIESGQGENAITLTNVRGELRWYNTTVEPLRDAAGHITAGLVIARDIHELRTAQQELEAYREKMIRAEHLASLGTLSAMLSHQMMQPLTVIRLSIQNALESLQGVAVPPTALEDLNDGLAGVSDAAAIVRRFRDFAGRTSGPKLDNVLLSAVARRVMPLLEESARRAQVVLDVSQLEELPPLQVNGRDLEQVFFALAQNAIQAADGGQERLFRIVGACRGEHMELQFADNCGGIAPEILDRVFDPFVTTKRAGEGTGLGLCVVHRIVSQAGGHLTVNSRWGEGTTFVVTLPREPTPTRSPDAQRPSGPRAGRAP